MNEMSKIKDKVMPYLTGKILDIGCADCKIVPEAIGIDGRDLPGVDLVVPAHLISHLYNNYGDRLYRANVIFSSHCLEHLLDDYAALWDWSKLIVEGGYLILYLPEASAYDSYQNEEHCRNYNYKDFMFFFERCFCGKGKNFKGEPFLKTFEVVDSGLDIGEDRYSFYLIAKKII